MGEWDKRFLERQWLAHAVDGFPREMSIFSIGKRLQCRNAKNYVTLLHEAYNNTTCFTRFLAEDCYKADGSILLNKIPIDIDVKIKDLTKRQSEWASDLPAAYDLMKGWVRFFRTQYDYDPVVNFSGSKGFHVWVHFEEPILIQRYAPTLHAYFDPLAEKGLTLDADITFDRHRMMRIPFTINEKSKKYCRPIDPDWDISTIVKNEFPDKEVEIRFCKKIDLQLAKLDRVEEQRLKQVSQVNSESLPIFTPHTNNEVKYNRFVDEVARLYHLRPKYAAGRHRTMWAILVPRLAFIYSDGRYAGSAKSAKLTVQERIAIEQRVLMTVMDWVLNTPYIDADTNLPRKTDSNYSDYCKAILRQIVENGYNPWSIEKFLSRYPELAQYWLD